MPPKVNVGRSMTLNIKEAQVLLHVPDDVDGVTWHRRVLVLQIRGGKWVSLDPEHELCMLDLDTSDYILLDRNVDSPSEKYSDTFCFEITTQAEMVAFRKRARTFLALHGDGGVEAAEQVWVVSDPRDEYFGKVVPQSAVDDSEMIVDGGSKGIVEHEDEFRFVEQVSKSELTDLLKKWRASDSDIRILKVQRDAAGSRNRPLSDAVPFYTEEKVDDWPHTGDRAFREASDAVLRTAQGWKAYHTRWRMDSGIMTGSSLCHEHETLCEAFRLGHEVDQLNCSNVCAFELLMRRMIQIEMAVSRNSKAPDFTGLSVVLSSVTDGSGAVQTKGFHKWVADKNFARASIMKSERLYHEERATARKQVKGAPKGGKDSKGRGKGGSPAPALEA